MFESDLCELAFSEACTDPPSPAYFRTVPAMPTLLHSRPQRRRGNSRFRKTRLSANRPPSKRRSRLAANPRVVLLGPFGESLTTPTGLAAELPFRFSTHYTDQETGLVFAKQRYYTPITGRWLSRDPIEEEGGLNLYGYVGNDPVDDFDALGEQAHMNYRALKIWFFWPVSTLLPLTGHVFLSFDEKGFSSSEKQQWLKLKNKLGVRPGFGGTNTFSFHPESVYIDRRKREKTLPKNFNNGNRLWVLVTRGAFVEVDNRENDIEVIAHSVRRLVADTYCEQAKLLREAVKSAKINNGGTLYGDLGGGTDPGPYSFLEGNCGHWAELMAERAGLNKSNWGQRAGNSAARAKWNMGVGHGTGLAPVGSGIKHTLDWIFRLSDSVTKNPPTPRSIPPRPAGGRQ